MLVRMLVRKTTFTDHLQKPSKNRQKRTMTCVYVSSLYYTVYHGFIIEKKGVFSIIV